MPYLLIHKIVELEKVSETECYVKYKKSKEDNITKARITPSLYKFYMRSFRRRKTKV